MKLLKSIDKFKAERFCEAYELPNGKILVVEDEGGVIFLGDRKEYYQWKQAGFIRKIQVNQPIDAHMLCQYVSKVDRLY